MSSWFQIYLVGRICAARASVFHEFHHYEFSLKQQCQEKVSPTQSNHCLFICCCYLFTSFTFVLFFSTLFFPKNIFICTLSLFALLFYFLLFDFFAFSFSFPPFCSFHLFILLFLSPFLPPYLFFLSVSLTDFHFFLLFANMLLYHLTTAPTLHIKYPEVSPFFAFLNLYPWSFYWLYSHVCHQVDCFAPKMDCVTANKEDIVKRCLDDSDWVEEVSLAMLQHYPGNKT